MKHDYTQTKYYRKKDLVQDTLNKLRTYNYKISDDRILFFSKERKRELCEEWIIGEKNINCIIGILDRQNKKKTAINRNPYLY